MLRFTATPTAEGIDITAQRRKLIGTIRVPVAEWDGFPEPQFRVAWALLTFVERGAATASAMAVSVSHGIAAGLPAKLADATGLPSLSLLSVTLSLDGRVETPEGRIRARWYDATSRIVHPRRVGSIQDWGAKHSGRLSKPMFDLIEAVDGFNASAGASTEARVAAWQPVQAALQSVTGEPVSADAVLNSFTVYQAGAFALDVVETPNGPDFVPIPMARSKRMSLDDDAPVEDGEGRQVPGPRDEVADALLPPDLQRQFTTRIFPQPHPTRDAYVLGRNVFMVVDAELKTALDVVRRKRSASVEERRAFVRNPRPALAEAGGQDAAASSPFVETQAYSDRVLGLALWEPPVLPWLTAKTTQWLPERFELVIGQCKVAMTTKGFDRLVGDVEVARQGGQTTIAVAGKAHPVADVEAAIAAVRPSETATPSGLAEEGTVFDGTLSPKRHVLQIKTNLEGVDYTLSHDARQASTGPDVPLVMLSASRPKAHQVQGFRWLVECWKAGWPGVLLADDMGLGKTFQALMFMAWVKDQQGKGPALVVAPTALLLNWAKEAALHLAPHALGHRVDAFGRELGRLKKPRSADWTPEEALDVDILRQADWILTTYETLADNHRSFARIGCRLVIFDEMQKVKSPGTINTQAAKALNADFVLGMTGTPIENRLEDLWCIMDRVAPGYLGDLKAFSTAHAEQAPEALSDLKAKLDQPRPPAPAIMLRRMKEAILEGLPAKRIIKYPSDMPTEQAAAYAKAVAAAQTGGRGPGDMLKALHAMRGISLHPAGAERVDAYDRTAAEAWVRQSARLMQGFEILRRVEAGGEKALFFIEDRVVQNMLATVLATMFGFRREPLIINGETPGAKRQAIVDQFQAAPPGFEILILSPKAAGIGLTITAASHVIHLSRWWNPAVEDQCNDRVYRIGQSKPVSIHIPIARHPVYGDTSFDVTLDHLLERKRALSRDMLIPPVSDGDANALFSATTAMDQLQAEAR